MRSRIFLGFFGVRGVAAVFYAAVVVESHALPPEQHVVVWTTIACVIASIVVHGLSATPLTNHPKYRGLSTIAVGADR